MNPLYYLLAQNISYNTKSLVISHEKILVNFTIQVFLGATPKERERNEGKTLAFLKNALRILSTNILLQYIFIQFLSIAEHFKE